MKKTIVLAAFVAALVSAQGQEKIEREECLKYAFVLCANLKDMLNTPIPTDPDVKHPVGMKEEQYGVLILPETKLSAETFAKLGTEVKPIGQLWMHKLVPLDGDQPVPASKLRIVHINSGDHEADVPCCALGVRKSADGKPELVIYGKAPEPVLHVALKPSSDKQDNPIEVSAEHKENGGLLTLKIAGKYEVSFMVTDPDKY